MINGRIKDILVTSTGEKIAPVDIEQAIHGRPPVRAGHGDRRAAAVHRRARRSSTAAGLSKRRRRSSAWTAPLDDVLRGGETLRYLRAAK